MKTELLYKICSPGFFLPVFLVLPGPVILPDAFPKLHQGVIWGFLNPAESEDWQTEGPTDGLLQTLPLLGLEKLE